jgi:hypothetical protein
MAAAPRRGLDRGADARARGPDRKAAPGGAAPSVRLAGDRPGDAGEPGRLGARPVAFGEGRKDAGAGTGGSADCSVAYSPAANAEQELACWRRRVAGAPMSVPDSFSGYGSRRILKEARRHVGDAANENLRRSDQAECRSVSRNRGAQRVKPPAGPATGRYGKSRWGPRPPRQQSNEPAKALSFDAGVALSGFACP